MPTATKSRESFRQYVGLLRDLHLLMAAGQGDSEQADAVRDQMDEPWRRLDEMQVARVRGLSADLYTLEGPPARTAPRPPTAASRGAAQALLAAKNRGNWDDVLALLRETEPYFPREVVAYLRGSIWLQLGFPGTAVLFFDRAARIAPENANYAWIALNTLVEAQQLEEAVAAAERILGKGEDTHPKLVFKAADVLFLRARALPDQEAAGTYQRLAQVLETAIGRAGLLPPGELSDSALVAALVELGMCHEHLRSDDAALAAYDQALEIEPGHEAALTARGILRYGRDMVASLRDLERATLQDTPLIWPYFYRAHHALTTGQYQGCLGFCEVALRRNPTDPVRADLLEWRAIARYETSGPVGEALADLDEAVRLAPKNLRIQRNRAELVRVLSQQQGRVEWGLAPQAEVWETGRTRLAA